MTENITLGDCDVVEVGNKLDDGINVESVLGISVLVQLGYTLGSTVGTAEGKWCGVRVEYTVGSKVDWLLGYGDGSRLGLADSLAVGINDEGLTVGDEDDGTTDGFTDGSDVGKSVGSPVGMLLDIYVG